MNPTGPSGEGVAGPGLAREFAELARVLQAESGRLGTLQTVCELAVKVIDADHASVAIRRGDAFRTVAATSDVPEFVDRLQLESGEGPSIDPVAHESLVSADLGTDTRWPDFGPRAAAEAHVRSMLSNRLFVRDGSIGLLTVYAARPAAFDERDVVVAGVFAAHAAVALQAAEEQERADNLEIALRNSRRIGTAIGILMHEHRVDEQGAFDLLRQRSQQTNRKLADVADHVVYTGTL
jgi:GAF domain-containing protein